MAEYRSLSNTLHLSTHPNNALIPVQEALIHGSPHHDALLRALCDTTPLARTRLSVAVTLASIVEVARANLESIAATLNDPTRVTPWLPNKYALKRLSDSEDLSSFFFKHVTVKAGVIFRIASSDDYVKIRNLEDADRLTLGKLYDSLPLHQEISEWIERYGGTLEARKNQGQAESGKTLKRKKDTEHGTASRKRIQVPIQDASSAIQLSTEPSKNNSAQSKETMNQNEPLYPNTSTRHDTFRMDSLAHVAVTAHDSDDFDTSLAQIYYPSQQGLQNPAPQSIYGQQEQEHVRRQGEEEHSTAVVDFDLDGDLDKVFLWRYSSTNPILSLQP